MISQIVFPKFSTWPKRLASGNVQDILKVANIENGYGDKNGNLPPENND